MGVVLVCLALLATGIILTVRLRTAEFKPPPDLVADGWQPRFRRGIWWVELWLATVLFTGLLIIGAGGRLAMRLLGALGGDGAQGRLTEADEVVGTVTIGGTVSFFMFVGLLTAAVTTVAYLLLRRALPRSRVSGVVFGTGLFVLLGTRNEPLRPGNEDFDLVGPWWVALVAFAGLALLHGAGTSAFLNWFSAWLPHHGWSARARVHLLLLLFIPLVPLGIVVSIALLVYVVAGSWLAAVARRLREPRAIDLVRIALVAAMVVALPGFALDVGDIVGRGPGLP